MDFKSIEYPLVNKSYTISNAGWLNDAIIDAYLALLVKEGAKRGERFFAFNTQFIRKLRRVCIPNKQKDFQNMISRYFRNVNYEIFDGMVIPINTGSGNHWCIVYIDCWNQTLYFYDPMHSGIENVTVVNLIRTYFVELYSFRSCSIDFEGKFFPAGFNVYWEDCFPTQEDCISCGLYILFYAKFRMGELQKIPRNATINASRFQITQELLYNKVTSNLHINPNEIKKKCLIPSRYEKRIGQLVTLRCFIKGKYPKLFQWVYKNKLVHSEPTYSFMLEEHNTGCYFCRVIYADGKNNTSNKCFVNVTKRKSVITAKC